MKYSCTATSNNVINNLSEINLAYIDISTSSVFYTSLNTLYDTNNICATLTDP
jgi:hypothetical protein